jgi:Immunoglobulin-like domain of bacterial spore germination/Sporulation and spore germination
MSTSMPTDHEIERELERTLAAEAERATPDPALQRILARAHEGKRPRTERWRHWRPILAGAVATAGIAAAAVVIFAPSEEPKGPETLQGPAPCAVEVREGCPVDLALSYLRSDLEATVSVGVTVTSSGNVGLDAVQALLDARSHYPAAVNPWHGYDTIPPDAGPIAEVNDVAHADGVVTVDFDRPLTSNLPSIQQSSPEAGRAILQQLVRTVQSGLRTEDPVRITIDGEPAGEAFDIRLPDRIDVDAALIDGIRLEQPEQEATLASPVVVSGESTAFEGTISWSVTETGRQVRRSFTTGGANGKYAPFEFEIELPPGSYTLKLWAPNVASGAEAWTDELSVVYVDFTVE